MRYKLYFMDLLILMPVMLIGSVTAQTWTAVGPVPRWAHSAVLDTTTNAMVVFGGQIPGTNDTGHVNLNDVWRLNHGLTWTELKPTGTPPAGRVEHSAVYDELNNRMIVFGGAEGNAAPCANDVWVLTTATGLGGTPAWLQLSTTGGPPAPRAQHGAVYDPNTNSMIVYGGQDCFSTTFGDVWVLSDANGLGGGPTWTQLFPAGSGPGAREISGGVAYDPTSNRLIVFGGQSSTGVLENDVWVLSNANGQGGTPTWTQLFPSGSLPAARTDHATVYDSIHNRLIIVGGGGNISLLNDVWVLTNANGLGGTPVWRQLGPFSLFAEARAWHSSVYNPTTNKITIFGGATVAGALAATNDAWVLSHANGK
jgi:hypothetical protein